MDSHYHRRGGIFRRFILSQLLVITAGGSLGVFWSIHHQRQVERERMLQNVQNHADLTASLNLPASDKLATHLSKLSGYSIGFAQNQTLSSHPGFQDAQLTAAQEAIDHPGEIIQLDQLEAIAISIPSRDYQLVAVHPTTRLNNHLGPLLILPLLAGASLAVGCAFVIARSIVNPLRQLARALPHSIENDGFHPPEWLVHRNDEIGTLTRSLIYQHQELIEEQELRSKSEHMALLGQLATSLAHEIKNPAAAIEMHAKSLDGNAQQLMAAEIIQREAEHIAALVNQWLYVAQPSPPSLREHDLGAILTTLSRTLEPLLSFHRSRLVLDLPDSPILISCDASRIQQVFRNLIDNARQAMPTGGTIYLSAAATDGKVTFAVRDEGNGFSEHALEHFGEAFYSEKEGGMGLGLKLVRSIIQAHGGEVTASNHPAGGALVSGSLPAHSPASTHIS